MRKLQQKLDTQKTIDDQRALTDDILNVLKARQNEDEQLQLQIAECKIQIKEKNQQRIEQQKKIKELQDKINDTQLKIAQNNQNFSQQILQTEDQIQKMQAQCQQLYPQIEEISQINEELGQQRVQKLEQNTQLKKQYDILKHREDYFKQYHNLLVKQVDTNKNNLKNIQKQAQQIHGHKATRFAQTDQNNFQQGNKYIHELLDKLNQQIQIAVIKSKVESICNELNLYHNITDIKQQQLIEFKNTQGKEGVGLDIQLQELSQNILQTRQYNVNQLEQLVQDTYKLVFRREMDLEIQYNKLKELQEQQLQQQLNAKKANKFQFVDQPSGAPITFKSQPEKTESIIQLTEQAKQPKQVDTKHESLKIQQQVIEIVEEPIIAIKQTYKDFCKQNGYKYISYYQDKQELIDKLQLEYLKKLNEIKPIDFQYL